MKSGAKQIWGFLSPSGEQNTVAKLLASCFAKRFFHKVMKGGLQYTDNTFSIL
jgi:hypothetical protein